LFTDAGANAQAQHTGTVTWISDKAEFTPKTIQTKDERANLVYAVKIIVRNNGSLKIGMYAEIKF
jgi:HlyD family secretion protein